VNRPILYVNTRLVSGVAIPLPMQTSYLRDYCKRRSIEFALPTAEYGFGGRYPALSRILSLRKSTILISTSLILPPLSSFEWSAFLTRKRCESRFHLIMERQVISIFEVVD